MNYLFNLASSARCLAQDRESDCHEKDVLIRDLKEKIVKFSNFVRYLEIQKADLAHQVKAQLPMGHPHWYSILQASELIKRSAEENLINEHSLKKQRGVLKAQLFGNLIPSAKVHLAYQLKGKVFVVPKLIQRICISVIGPSTIDNQIKQQRRFRSF
ncbi:hypothetical protein Bca101_088348 [Brassica carinata]